MKILPGSLVLLGFLAVGVLADISHSSKAASKGESLCQQKPKAAKKRKKVQRPFNWVSPANLESLGKIAKGLRHATFESPSMGIEVGYHIYLPPGYEKDEKRRYPVVFHLHGGRPGGEYKSVNLAGFVDKAIRAKKLQPTIYVFPNGGPMSWYNYPKLENGLGEDVFVKELLPHIDKTYRTIGGREGRAIEGFSQGGRGTTRILMKYPELWCSAAPGGSGYGPEKRIQENEGWESEKIRFLPVGYNAWDLTAQQAENSKVKTPPILIWVGTKGFNYEDNLKYSKYLDSLGIAHKILFAPEIGHSAREIYSLKGMELMKFHEANFKGI